MSDTTDWAAIAQKLHQDCRQLERELSMVKEQRNGAFALIEYAGELLGVKPEKHKSAHGFAVLQAIKDLISSKS